MSANGNLEFIAAKVSEIDRALKAANDEKLDRFTSLLSSLESTASDLLDNSERGGGAAAIKAMTEAMSGFAEKLAAAVAAMKPPDVNVTPTFNTPQQQPLTLAQDSVRALAAAFQDIQINVEASMPQGAAPNVVFNAPQAVSWELRQKMPYGPDKIITVTPSYAKD